MCTIFKTSEQRKFEKEAKKDLNEIKDILNKVNSIYYFPRMYLPPYDSLKPKIYQTPDDKMLIRSYERIFLFEETVKEIKDRLWERTAKYFSRADGEILDYIADYEEILKASGVRKSQKNVINFGYVDSRDMSNLPRAGGLKKELPSEKAKRRNER